MTREKIEYDNYFALLLVEVLPLFPLLQRGEATSNIQHVTVKCMTLDVEKVKVYGLRFPLRSKHRMEKVRGKIISREMV